MRAVRRPIILVGTGCCGSTLLHRLLGEHPRLAWISVIADVAPSQPWLNGALMRTVDTPGLGTLLTRVLWPTEPYSFWEHHCRGFTQPCRDLVAEDVTPKVEARLQSVLARVLTTRRDRLLLKITGWPRIGFLRRVFPDGLFVHIVRDGRAVVNSLIDVSWWRGWRGPHGWQYGPLTEEQNALWERCDRSFTSLAAIQWTMMVEAVQHASSTLPAGQFTVVRYEDLCADPGAELGRLVAFADLPTAPDFEARLARHPIRRASHRWQSELGAEQQTMITEIMRPHLHELSYL